MKTDIEGQLTIFDIYGPDLWCGKTSPEPSQATAAKTSAPSSKKRQESRSRGLIFLDLRTENGHTPESSWRTGGALPGDYMTLNTGECPSVEKESRLSQILQGGAHRKYYLSAKACQGILNRAKRRGKILPEMLQKALETQISLMSEYQATEQATGAPTPTKPTEPEHSTQGGANPDSNHGGIAVCFGMSSFDSNGMKSANPHSGIYKAETSRTLDMNGGTPACNQGGMMVVERPQAFADKAACLNAQDGRGGVRSQKISDPEGNFVVEGFDAYNQQGTGTVSMTLTAKQTDTHHIPTVCIEGNGTRESHQGDGYKESDVMFTLNTIERHAVAAPVMCLNDQGGGGDAHDPRHDGNAPSAGTRTRADSMPE